MSIDTTHLEQWLKEYGSQADHETLLALIKDNKDLEAENDDFAASIHELGKQNDELEKLSKFDSFPTIIQSMVSLKIINRDGELDPDQLAYNIQYNSDFASLSGLKELL